MKARISALMDGELDDYDIPDTLRALHRSPELRSEWCDGHLIGAALRGESGLDVDVLAKVMSAIELEPTVMAPAPRRALQWQRPALALAASAAGVTVVAWLALAPVGNSAPMADLALAKPATVAPQQKTTPRLQEYLLAHQAYAPGGAMVGGARNIRTVTSSGAGR